MKMIREKMSRLKYMNNLKEMCSIINFRLYGHGPRYRYPDEIESALCEMINARKRYYRAKMLMENAVYHYEKAKRKNE